MGLDFDQAIPQLDTLAHDISGSIANHQVKVDSLLNSAALLTESEITENLLNVKDRPFMAAMVHNTLVGNHLPQPSPTDWSVVSVDGSHIDIDRHLPLPCYLINLGGCVLTYGESSDAQFFSEPTLGGTQTDIYLRDPNSPNQEELITGPLLGIIRAIQELKMLTKVVEECPPELPVLALVDGTLVLWGLSGQGYRPFVRRELLQSGLFPALQALRDLAETRIITLAAYVSLPRTTEVTNAIRASLCPHPISLCQDNCNHNRANQSPCDISNNILDRELFAKALGKGERSSIYRTDPQAAQEYYGDHQVYFYYLNVGEEIARIEVPAWVAQNERLLSIGHSLIVEQCEKGNGYPVAISEAHEQAVINGSDRYLFREMVNQALERQGINTYTSQKDRSKRMPWL